MFYEIIGYFIRDRFDDVNQKRLNKISKKHTVGLSIADKIKLAILNFKLDCITMYEAGPDLRRLRRESRDLKKLEKKVRRISKEVGR